MIIIRVCDYEVTMAAGAVCVSLCHSLTVMRIQFSNVESLFQLWLKCVGGNFVASQLGTQNGGAPADLNRRFLGFSPASHDQLGPDPEVVEMVVGRMAVSRERETHTQPSGVLITAYKVCFSLKAASLSSGGHRGSGSAF